jgi:type III pantothenate kinase
MLLAIDIGNSDVTIGLHDQQTWKHIWRIPSVASRPELFYGIRIRDNFLEAGIGLSSVQKVVISSVVPDLTDKIINVAVTLFERDPIVLDTDVYRKLPIAVLNPYEIGSDLVANALAGFTLFKNGCIVVDFGTALTFTTISAKGEILGVAIAPGLKTSIRSLSQSAAKLFEVPLEMPPSVLGKNTIRAIQAGVLFTYEGGVKHVLQRVRAEAGANIPAVATGGLVSVIPSLPELVERIEPTLTLDGLKLIGDLYP